LTKEQLEKLQPLRADFEKETLSLRNDLELKSLELRHLWTADELDEEAIVAKSGEVSDLQAQLHEKMIRHRLDVAKILTKEQRARFLAGGARGLGTETRGRGRGGRPGMGAGKGRGHGFGSPRRGW
jgi:Spy/CpxP family protein refolding chaperone